MYFKRYYTNEVLKSLTCIHEMWVSGVSFQMIWPDTIPSSLQPNTFAPLRSGKYRDTQKRCNLSPQSWINRPEIVSKL